MSNTTSSSETTSPDGEATFNNNPSSEAATESGAKLPERSPGRINQEVESISADLKDDFSSEAGFEYLYEMRDTYQEVLTSSREAASAFFSEEGNKSLGKSLERVILKVKDLKGKKLDGLSNSEREQLVDRFAHNQATFRVGSKVEADIQAGIEQYEGMSDEEIQAAVEKKVKVVKPAILKVARFSDDEWLMTNDHGVYTPGAAAKLYKELTGIDLLGGTPEADESEPETPIKPAKPAEAQVKKPEPVAEPEPAPKPASKPQPTLGPTPPPQPNSTPRPAPPASAEVGAGEDPNRRPDPANPNRRPDPVVPGLDSALRQGLEGHITSVKHLDVLDNVNDFYSNKFNDALVSARDDIERGRGRHFKEFNEAVAAKEEELSRKLTDDERQQFELNFPREAAVAYADAQLKSRLNQGDFVDKLSLAGIVTVGDKDKLRATLMEVGRMDIKDWYGVDEQGEDIGEGVRDQIQYAFDIDPDEKTKTQKTKEWLDKTKDWANARYAALFGATSRVKDSWINRAGFQQLDNEGEEEFERRVKRQKIIYTTGLLATAAVMIITRDSSDILSGGIDWPWQSSGEAPVGGGGDPMHGAGPETGSSADPNVMTAGAPVNIAEGWQNLGEKVTDFAESVEATDAANEASAPSVFDWAEYAEAHPEALSAEPGDGWDLKFSQFGIDTEHHADMRQQLGDQLKEMGVAMDNLDDSSELWISKTGELPSDAVELILTTADDNGWLESATQAVTETTATPELDLSPEAIDIRPGGGIISEAADYGIADLTHDEINQLGEALTEEGTGYESSYLEQEFGNKYGIQYDADPNDGVKAGEFTPEAQEIFADFADDRQLNDSISGSSDTVATDVNYVEATDLGTNVGMTDQQAELDTTSAPGAAEFEMNNSTDTGLGPLGSADLGVNFGQTSPTGYQGELDITSAPGAAEFEVNNPIEEPAPKDLAAAREANPTDPVSTLDTSSAPGAAEYTMNNPAEPTPKELEAVREANPNDTIYQQMENIAGEYEISNDAYVQRVMQGEFSLLNSVTLNDFLLPEGLKTSDISSLASQLMETEGASFSDGRPIVELNTNMIGREYTFNDAEGANLTPKAEKIIKEFFTNLQARRS